MIPWLPFTANVFGFIAALFALLGLATLATWIVALRQDSAQAVELTQRLWTWWVIVILFVAALALGTGASLVLFGFLSFLALKEYFSIIPTRRADRRVLFWAYLAVPVQYWWVADAWYGVFIIFIPVYMFMALPARMVAMGETEGFLKALGTIHWGLMITVYSLSHMAYLLVLPAEANPAGGGPGLALYLAFLTGLNDIAQYICGKLAGRSQIAPRVSPNKTWEGFLGGAATTALAGWALGPFLTPHQGVAALGAGGLIAIAGFFGDLTESALKRDLGIKDSGAALPGHGGILDRVDSLVFTAPLFFHYTYYLHY